MRKFFIAAAVAVIALFGLTSSAQAGFEMQIISSTAGTKTITDGGVGDANVAVPGEIIFIGSWGGFDLQVNTGDSKPVIGSAAAPQLDLSYKVTRTTAGAAETLTIQISDTDFTASPMPMNLNYGGTNGPGTTSSAVGGTGLSNALYNTGDASTTVPTSGTFGASAAFSGSGTFTVPNNGGSNYSLTVAVTLTNDGSAGVSSGDAHLTSAPAPAGLVLALTGMPALGLGAWVRRRRVAA